MYFAIITSSHILYVPFFYQYMVAFLFNIVIYIFLLKEFMYSYCCLCTCILIVLPCILIVVYVYLLLSILIVCPCILIVVYVFLLFVHVFLSLSMYTYCSPCILRRGYPDRFFRAFSSVVRQMPGCN